MNASSSASLGALAPVQRTTATTASPQRSSATADDRDLGDRGMRRDRRFDLGRVHVDAARDDHVLEPAGDAQVAAAVHRREVAGVQPPVGVDRVGGRVRARRSTPP